MTCDDVYNGACQSSEWPRSEHKQAIHSDQLSAQRDFRAMASILYLLLSLTL